MLSRATLLAAIEPLAPATALLVFSAALGAAGIGILVLVRERGSRESLFFSLFALAIVIWFLSFALMYLGPDLEWAGFWARVAYLGVPFIAPTAYLFGLRVARHPAPHASMLVVWAIGATFMFLGVTTDLLVSHVRVYSWGPYPVYGPAGPAFVGFVTVVILLLVRRLWWEGRRAKESFHRRRMQGMAVAFAIAGCGAVDFLPKFGFAIFPLGFLAFFGFLAISGAIIYRYRLVDYTPSLAAADVLETMADALLVVDPRGRVRLTNRAAEDILGYSSQALLGQSLRELRSRLEVERNSLAGFSGEVRDVVVRLRTRSGELREVSVSTSPLRHEGERHLGWVILLRDVTERRAMEDQLMQAQKLEAVGRLAGGVAHDFNNFLTAMKGHVRFVLDRLVGDEPSRREMEILGETVDRASRLTRQLLAFGRKGAGEPEVFRLGSVAREMEGMLRRLVGDDVVVEVRTSEEERPVRANRGQAEQVLLNLVVNAREAMPHGGTIQISVEPVVLERPASSPDGPDLPAGSYTRLSVRDTGTGMTAATRRRIFEPFFSTKERDRGGGLGLATVYGIATGAGGTIVVDTEPGVGTTFKVFLPSGSAASEEDAPRGPGSVRSNRVRATSVEGATVLAVEDDEAVRRVIRRALEGAGLRVLAAADAAEALRLLEQGGKVTAVVTDAVMPGMAGPELLRKLRERGVDAPAILVSGYAEEELQRHGKLPDGVELMTKPFEPEELVRRVRKLLHRPAPSS